MRKLILRRGVYGQDKTKRLLKLVVSFLLVVICQTIRYVLNLLGLSRYKFKAINKSGTPLLKLTRIRLNKANELILRLLSKNQNKAIVAMAPEPKPKVSFW